MIVPIDLLTPILDDMLSMGRPNRPPRPWLGMLHHGSNGQLIRRRPCTRRPGRAQRVRMGDLVLEVAGAVWRTWLIFFATCGTGRRRHRDSAHGRARGSVVKLRLRSADRNDFLKKPQLH
jgi:hypothetical protein